VLVPQDVLNTADFLPPDPAVTRCLIETTWRVATTQERERIVGIIQRESEQTNETGHGKAQRAFARQLLHAIAGGTQ